MKKPTRGVLGTGGNSGRRSAADARVDTVSRQSAAQTADFFNMRTLPLACFPIERGDDLFGVQWVQLGKEPVCTSICVARSPNQGQRASAAAIPPFARGRNPPSPKSVPFSR